MRPPRFVLHDRDAKFPPPFDTVFASEGMGVMHTCIGWMAHPCEHSRKGEGDSALAQVLLPGDQRTSVAAFP